MKKFILLFMLVFGINTAVNAQTKIQFSDEKGNVIDTIELENSLSSTEIANFKSFSTTTTSNRPIGGTFRVDVWVRYPGFDFYEHEWGGPFNWYVGETMDDIYRRIIAIFG